MNTHDLNSNDETQGGKLGLVGWLVGWLAS